MTDRTMKLSGVATMIIVFVLAKQSVSGFAPAACCPSTNSFKGLHTPTFSMRAATLRFAVGEKKGEARLSEDLAPEERLDRSLEEPSLSNAISILNENPRLDLSRDRWNSVFDAIERRTTDAEENIENKRLLESQSQYQVQSPARNEMTLLYGTLKKLDHLRLFGAAAEYPPAAGSHVVTPMMLEEVTGLSMVALTPKPTNTLLIAGVFLALSEGIASLTLGWDVNFLAFATIALAFLDRIVTNGAVFESFVKIFSPGVQDKIVRHEAGHFLTAYLLGLPVEGCVLSAWAALQDARFDKREISAGTSFFDPVLSDQINRSVVSRSSIDRYSIVVMAGIAAEAMNFGRADGGAGDEMALVAFLSMLNNGGRAQKGGQVAAWNNDSIRNQARWGALQSVLMLRHYRPCYDALVDALERGGTLGDCIYAIEKAGRDAGLTPLDKPLGFILDEGPYGVWTKDAPKGADTTVALEVNESQSRTFDQDDSLRALKEYRAQVESRLQDIEIKLKQIEE